MFSVAVVFLAFAFSPVYVGGNLFSALNLNVQVPDLAGVSLASETCIREVAAKGEECFGSIGGARLNSSQMLQLAFQLIPNLVNPISLVSTEYGILSTFGADAVANTIRSLCSSQSCINGLADLLRSCVPNFDDYEQAFTLLFNIFTEFVCATNRQGGQLCLELFIRNNMIVTQLACGLTASITSTTCNIVCQASVQSATTTIGCCYNNLFDAFEKTTGIDISALKTFADTIWQTCNVDSPGQCAATGVANPLTASGSGALGMRHGSAQRGLLPLLLTLLAVYCWRFY